MDTTAPLVRMPRVETLLGSAIDRSLTVDSIERLVDEQVAEFDQLDFKRDLYGDTAKDALAKDVAAFANHIGGLIVVGVAEARAVASKAMPFAATDADVRHVRSVIVERVAPFVPVDAFVVGSGSEAYLLIAVGASPWSPHAVIVPGEHHLRYPVRNGTQARWLGESEVAERYRSRERAATDQIERLARVAADGTADLDRSAPWLYVACVPNVLGTGTITRELLREWNTWLDREAWPGPGGQKHIHRLNEVGVGRALMVSRRVADTPTGTYAELYADGCSFAAAQTARWLRSEAGLTNTWKLDPWTIIDRIAGFLFVQAQHALRAAGGHDGVVEVGLVQADPELNQTSTQMVLDGDARLEETRFRNEVPSSRRTLSLSSIAASATDLLVATRLLATDIVQAFGLVEVPHLDGDGRIVLDSLGHGATRREAKAWADFLGADTV